MAIRRRASSDEAADVNVTPLLDIVFIMLIFFIVTATFVYEDGITPTLPDPSPEDQDTQPPPTLLLSVQSNGFVRVDNIREVDPRSVSSVVEQFFARENDKAVVIISAAGEASTGDTITTLDEARIAAGPARYGRITVTAQDE
ncbi:Biopolymer transport protein ExbD/TolR [Parvularcula bermudensis HTCC2503]|uniref:Biopolymer transport protein ExbD/TolR n=1 Tax=Parvularcula bermudensis (strain ATCC BAA-594 / HTCC2503 / KCTC 12087) TaxID=314260 RepID=E0TI20_PARBH|nr:biopolymer transporter ExbD [Parvularcula bermudensis]ADM09359.1 Biopolymer transport protein ExbD/TolR [Parvularcula bermudensis HTCC2503]